MADTTTTYIEVPNPFSVTGQPAFRETISPAPAAPTKAGTVPVATVDVNPYTQGAAAVVPVDTFLGPFLETIRVGAKRGSFSQGLSREVETILKDQTGEVWYFGPTDLAPANSVNPLDSMTLDGVAPADEPAVREQIRVAYHDEILARAQQLASDRLAERVHVATVYAYQNGVVVPANTDMAEFKGLSNDVLGVLRDTNVLPAPLVDTMKLAMSAAFEKGSYGNWGKYLENLSEYREAFMQGPGRAIINTVMEQVGLTNALNGIIPGLGDVANQAIEELLTGKLNEVLGKSRTASETFVQLVQLEVTKPDLDTIAALTAYGGYLAVADDLAKALDDELKAFYNELADQHKLAEQVMAAGKVQEDWLHSNDGSKWAGGGAHQTITGTPTKTYGAYKPNPTPMHQWQSLDGTKKVSFMLMPARASNGVGKSGPQAPGVGAGLTYRTVMNLVALNIPGRGPEYQPFGIKGEIIEYVGTFIGYDPQADIINELKGQPANVSAMREMGLAWDESQEAAAVVRSGEKIKLVIKTGTINLEEIGWVESMDRVVSRDDMVWYQVRFRVDSKKKCEGATPSAKTPGFEAITPGKVTAAVATPAAAQPVSDGKCHPTSYGSLKAIFERRLAEMVAVGNDGGLTSGTALKVLVTPPNKPNLTWPKAVEALENKDRQTLQRYYADKDFTNRLATIVHSRLVHQSQLMIDFLYLLDEAKRMDQLAQAIADPKKESSLPRDIRHDLSNISGFAANSVETIQKTLLTKKNELYEKQKCRVQKLENAFWPKFNAAVEYKIKPKVRGEVGISIPEWGLSFQKLADLQTWVRNTREGF